MVVVTDAHGTHRKAGKESWRGQLLESSCLGPDAWVHWYQLVSTGSLTCPGKSQTALGGLFKTHSENPLSKA